MRTVLIVTYYFPPRPAVGGLRPFGLAKFLPQFGWEAAVLTPELPGKPTPGFNILETGYSDSFGFIKRCLGLDTEQNLTAQVAQLKKKLRIRSEKSVFDYLLAAWGALTAYPDPQKGWRPHAAAAGGAFLQHEPVDAIISTSSPATTHLVAAELKAKHGTPWLADLRDLWTQNPYYPYGPLRRAVERRLELRTLGGADALVTISQPTAGQLGELHRGKPVHAITNGFDPDEVAGAGGKLTDKFTITYTGNIYPGKRSPELLFAALSDLISAKTVDASDVEVRLYGAEEGWIDKQAGQFGLTGIVRQYGIVPRDLALSRQRESQLLLLTKWNDPRERGAYSAKLFEYLAARRPILAVGGHRDVVDELLEETKAGGSGSTLAEARSLLQQFYQEYKASGQVRYRGQGNEIGKYSQREMARKFAEVLDTISG